MHERHIPLIFFFFPLSFFAFQIEKKLPFFCVCSDNELQFFFPHQKSDG